MSAGRCRDLEPAQGSLRLIVGNVDAEADEALGDHLLHRAIRAAVRGPALGGVELRRIVQEVGSPRATAYLDAVAPELVRA